MLQAYLLMHLSSNMLITLAQINWALAQILGRHACAFPTWPALATLSSALQWAVLGLVLVSSLIPDCAAELS